MHTAPSLCVAGPTVVELVEGGVDEARGGGALAEPGGGVWSAMSFWCKNQTFNFIKHFGEKTNLKINLNEGFQ